MKALLLTILFLIPYYSFKYAQSVSFSQKININQNSCFGLSGFNVHKKNLSGGFTFGYGNFGSANFNSEDVFPSYLFYQKNYPTYKGFQYDIKKYRIRNTGLSLGLNAETNWNKENNALILGISLSIYIITEKLNVTHSFPWGVYKPEEKSEFINVNYTIFHKNISAGIYLGYQRELTRKISINFLVNFPYYFPLHTDTYNIFGVEYLMVALEPNISVGINFIIKK